MGKRVIDTSALRTAIATQIRIERAKRRWSQDVLAERAELGRRTVQRLETERIDLNIEHMNALGKAFGMTWFQFLTLVNDVHGTAK